MRRKPRPSRAGLSLIEVVISTLLVGMVLVGALKSVGAVIRGRMRTGDTSNSQHLASQLMAEILQAHYQEPISTPAFGLEASESNTQRANWDDVDDYHLWAESPPQDQSGNPLPNSRGWERSVVVDYVNPFNPSQTVGSNQGVKRITVTVRKSGTALAQISALRSNKYPGT